MAAEDKDTKETEFSILHRDAIDRKLLLGPPRLFLNCVMWRGCFRVASDPMEAGKH